MKTKIEQIWDLVLELDEGESVTGMIRYPVGTGRLTLTLDGRRVTVYVEVEVDDEGGKW